MVKFKNMKILVENNLAEIVGDLESKGYTPQIILCSPTWVITSGLGRYSLFQHEPSDIYRKYETTTLTELRSMNIETLKEM